MGKLPRNLRASELAFATGLHVQMETVAQHGLRRCAFVLSLVNFHRWSTSKLTMRQFLPFLCLVSSTLASYAGNLNYRSPSHNHPSLGISIHKVHEGQAFLDMVELTISRSTSATSTRPTHMTVTR